VPGSEAIAVVVWGQGLEVEKLTVLETEHFDSARVLWVTRTGIIAASHQHDRLSGRRYSELVGIESGIELLLLYYLITNGGIRIDAVDRDTAGNIVGDEQESAATIYRGMYRAIRQCYDWPVRDEGAVRSHPIHLRTVPPGVGIKAAGLGIAGDDIEKAAARMWPRILHIGR
jgi:hypothetical protein